MTFFVRSLDAAESEIVAAAIRRTLASGAYQVTGAIFVTAEERSTFLASLRDIGLHRIKARAWSLWIRGHGHLG